MPYSSSGLYTLPSSYKATPDTTIFSSSQHNTPLEDIKEALNLSFLRDGRAPMTGQLTLFGNAVDPLHAVPKQQLDAIIKLFGSPFNSISAGPGARPDPHDSGGILTGVNTIAIGDSVLSSANNNATNSNFIGTYAGAFANNLYCVNGVGFRNLQELADGQYCDAFGTDIGLHLAFSRQFAALGAKAGLHKTDIRDSILAGSAGYAGGTLKSVIALGWNALDGGQPADHAAALLDPYDVENVIVMGNYAGRYLKMTGGVGGMFYGHNCASITTVTGQGNHAFARGGFAALTSGTYNTIGGDGSGGLTSTGHFNTSWGALAGPASGALSNTLNLGFNAQATESNQAQIGDGSLTKFKTYASILPNVTNVQNIGSATEVWNNVYAKSVLANNVAFPATAVLSADPTTFDRYKEDQWTPTVTSTGGVLGGYTSEGKYQILGNRLHYTVTIVITSVGTANGFLDITFPIISAGPIVAHGGNASTGLGVWGSAAPGSTAIRLYSSAAGSPFSGAHTIRFEGSYEI
jgi:hypothetical protein